MLRGKGENLSFFSLSLGAICRVDVYSFMHSTNLGLHNLKHGNSKDKH